MSDYECDVWGCVNRVEVAGDRCDWCLSHRWVVTDEEVKHLHLDRHPNTWGDLIRPVLVAKGCPDRALYTGSLEIGMERHEVDKCTSFWIKPEYASKYA